MRNRAAIAEKSYRNPEIGENLQVRLASYPGLSYRMFLIGAQAVRDSEVSTLAHLDGVRLVYIDMCRKTGVRLRARLRSLSQPCRTNPAFTV